MNSETFSVYILKSSPTVMTYAETYLRNRGCTVGSGSNLKEALAYVIQKQPQFVLLSADHPNKKVKVLPKLLAQAFPVKVIGFAEKAGGTSAKNLDEMKLEYTLHAPVSGPGIQRLIRKMRKDDEAKAAQASAKTNPDGTAADINADSAITFKGDSSAREALNQLLSATNEDNSAEKGYYLDKGQALKTGAAYQGGTAAPGTTSGYTPESQNAAMPPKVDLRPEDQQPGESFDAWAERMRQSLQANTKDPHSKANSVATNSPDFVANSNPPIGSLPFPGAKAELSPSGSTDQSDWKGLGPKPSPIMESEYQRKDAKKNYSFKSSKDSGFHRADSVMVRGTQEAIDQTVNFAGPPGEEIESSSNVACITIKSPRFSGYLLCAMGKNKTVDQSLIQTIQKRLFEFLRSNGEQVTPEDTMNIQIKEIEFEGWALSQADFLKKSLHDGCEIAMAFFPSKETQFELEESTSSSMLKMTIDELKSDVPLEFDLYIYLPENRKYLLYTPQGKNFYGKQKYRLMEKGVTHLHLKKESAAQVKKYRAQNYLNDRIDAYRQALSLKKTDSEIN